MSKHVRNGQGAARPYLQGPLSLAAFVQGVFDAKELERHEFSPEAVHVAFQIGDGVVVLEAGDLPDDVEPWHSAVYVYVEDVDAVYNRAIEQGATAIAPPTDKPYEERQAGFRDGGGNTWWIATYTG